MKRTAVFFALLMGVQILGSSLIYAGGMKGGRYYSGGEVGEESVAFFAPLDRIFSFLFPHEKVALAPRVGPIGGKEANAPNPFVCRGKGVKFVQEGSTVRTVYCD